MNYSSIMNNKNLNKPVITKSRNVKREEYNYMDELLRIGQEKGFFHDCELEHLSDKALKQFCDSLPKRTLKECDLKGCVELYIEMRDDSYYRPHALDTNFYS
jgi:hypothetical protein